MRRTALAVLALLPAALTACGSNDAAAKAPAVSAFADGTCRVAAPDVLAIGKAGATLGKGSTVPSAVRTSLREAQTRLRSLAEAAEPSYKPSFDALVVSTGFVRIRADGNTYDASLGRQLMSDYRKVLAVCSSSQAGR